MIWNIHVIPHVSHGAGVDRAEPEHIHAQVLEVVEFRGYTVEIAESVTIGIAEARRVDLENDCRLPPRMACVGFGDGHLGNRNRAMTTSEG